MTIWWSLERDDWLEAFRSHPKIGEKKAADSRFGPIAPVVWTGTSRSKQRSSSETVDSLAALNRAYEQKVWLHFYHLRDGKNFR